MVKASFLLVSYVSNKGLTGALISALSEWKEKQNDLFNALFTTVNIEEQDKKPQSYIVMKVCKTVEHRDRTNQRDKVFLSFIFFGDLVSDETAFQRRKCDAVHGVHAAGTHLIF